MTFNNDMGVIGVLKKMVCSSVAQDNASFYKNIFG